MKTQLKRGRKPILSKDSPRLLQKFLEKNPFISQTKLAQMCGFAHRQSLLNALLALGYEMKTITVIHEKRDCN